MAKSSPKLSQKKNRVNSHKHDIKNQPVRKRASREISKILRQARIDKGLSQVQVAEKMGYASAQYISDWERARSPVPLNRLVELAGIVDINIDHLFDLFLDFSVERLTCEIKSEYQALRHKK